MASHLNVVELVIVIPPTARVTAALPTTLPVAVDENVTLHWPATVPVAEQVLVMTELLAPSVTITYTDASGMRRVLPNQYIPWTITLTPISASDVGLIEASSLLRLSKLNCKVTASDGTVLSANENNQPQVNC